MNASDTEPKQSVDLQTGPSTLKRYLFAFVATLIAFLIRKALDPALQHSTTKHIFITFIVATTLVAWYSGFVPSLLTFIAGFILADYFFLDPRHSFDVPTVDFLQLVLPPVLVSMTIILFGRSMHLAREKANAHAREAINNQKKLESEVVERKRAEEEVRRLNTELEERVQLRTAELLASNRDLESFTYSVSHDLRAPLRHVDGYAQMLVEEHGSQLPPEALKLSQKIRQGSQNMGRLVDDLLNLSRVGKQPLAIKQVPLNALLNEAIAEIKPEIGDRRVEWQIGELPAVQGDPGLLRQVFVNLLSNAVKYSRMSEISVVEIGEMAVDGEKAIFVRDNGVGFNMKYASKLFGVFQRLHRVEEFEGTGVGLATVARIINKHGGKIWAEAEVNKGAKFYFILPAVQRHVTPANAQPVPAMAMERI
ncbi:MAG TPA: ATP-binding protein [Verrucomicrobiae bacterium]|nr:ATP-binding protein [Verrucomicrobiae bacterium]